MEVAEALVWFLRAAWIVGTVPILVALLPFPGSSYLRWIISTTSNRGKTLYSSTKRFLVPQGYFLHFYILGVFCTTCLLISVWCNAPKEEFPWASMGQTAMITKTESLGGVRKVAFTLFLMEIQVLRRLYESIFVFDYSKSAKMHVVGYLVGLFFYTATPLSIFMTAFPETWHLSGSEVGMCPSRLGLADHIKCLVKLGWCQWVGAAIWFWGSVHQYRCHSILGSIKKQFGSNKYVVAEGDWFELVSCPHYLAEIVIYTGILVSSGGSDLTMWLLFAFVVMNLVFAAIETHQWYCLKFVNYPSSRRAIFPLIL